MSLAVRKLPLGHSSASFSLAAALNPSKPPNHLYLPCSRWVCPGREPFGSRQDLFRARIDFPFPAFWSGAVASLVRMFAGVFTLSRRVNPLR